MTKQCLFWKPVICKSVRGRDFESSFPDSLAQIHRGNLVAAIQKMPAKEPISFARAIQMVTEKKIQAIKEHDGRKYAWYYRNFLQFVSDCGYHIELTGDEFVFHLATDQSI